MYIFIVNPVAGGGRGSRVYSTITESKMYDDLKSQSFFTQYKGHAEVILKSLLNTYKQDEIKAIIVIGGDGTLHEVMNGLSTHDIPIAFIPGGSGNDFARGCFIDKNPIKVLEHIINGEYILPYYVGTYTIDSHLPRIFTNNIGFGFDAMIAKTANQSKYKKILNKLRLGKISYVIALIQVLFKFKPIDLEIVVNKQKRNIPDCWMVTITNHPYYGGGMKIIPNSKIQPDVFPVLLIHSISKWKILSLFMTVFSGKHIHFNEVELFEATELSIKSSSKIDYQVDGESGSCFSAIISKRNQSVQVTGTTGNIAK